MSAQAQYIAKLYGADDYLITEMEAAAIAQVVQRTLGDGATRHHNHL
jgi:nucleoside phosphorylase